MATGNAQPDTSHIAGLLKAGTDYLLRPGNEKKDLDSAFFFFNQALALSESVRSDKWINATLEWKGNCYLEGNDLAPGMACFQKVIDYYHRNGDRRKEAETWSRLGGLITNFNAVFSTEKAKCYEKARQLYHIIGDTLMELWAYKNEADAHLYVPNQALAEKELLEVAEGYKAVHFRHLHYTYDLLRAIAKVNGDIAKEVFYSMEMVRSLDSTDAQDDSVLIGRLYSYAGNTFARAGMWDRALLYARKGWVWWKSRYWAAWGTDYFIAMRFLASDLIHMDSVREALVFVSEASRLHAPANAYQQTIISLITGNCYLALGDYEKAQKAILQLAAFIDSHKAFHPDQTNVEMDMEIILAIGNFYLSTRHWEKADAYAKKFPANFSHLVGLEVRARIQRFLMQADSSMGRYRSALTHFEAYQRMNDSLFGVQKAVQIQELQIRYAIGQKDKDLRIQAGDIQLLTKQNLLQQEQAGRSRILRNVMIAGLLVLLLLVGLIYNRSRLKQQKNRQLEVKQKEISDKNHQLERLLDENEWLLREVHHRVKNNLQVIMSLLKAQSDFLQDEAALAAIVESGHRVYAMSLIHQKLYKSNNVTSIGMPEYIGDLVEYLRYCFDPSRKIVFDLQVIPVNLDLQQAVPVGLILNEAITNSFKYAFPWSEEDRIAVRLFATEDGWLSLIIADNGRGLPPDFDPKQRNSFGMLLIGGLTEDLEGSLHIQSLHGTSVHIRFRHIEIEVIPEEGPRGSDYFNR
jgi:two-component sensor histidine kinase